MCPGTPTTVQFGGTSSITTDPAPIFEDIKVLQQENTELTNRVLELEGELRQMRKKERTEQK